MLKFAVLQHTKEWIVLLSCSISSGRRGSLTVRTRLRWWLVAGRQIFLLCQRFHITWLTTLLFNDTNANQPTLSLNQTTAYRASNIEPVAHCWSNNGNRTSPSDNSNSHWKRLCLDCGALCLNVKGADKKSSYLLTYRTVLMLTSSTVIKWLS